MDEKDFERAGLELKAGQQGLTSTNAVKMVLSGLGESIEGN